jgi:hypothetical protein
VFEYFFPPQNIDLTKDEALKDKITIEAKIGGFLIIQILYIILVKCSLTKWNILTMQL